MPQCRVRNTSLRLAYQMFQSSTVRLSIEKQLRGQKNRTWTWRMIIVMEGDDKKYWLGRELDWEQNRQISSYQIQMRVRDMHRQKWRVTDLSYQIQMVEERAGWVEKKIEAPSQTTSSSKQTNTRLVVSLYLVLPQMLVFDTANFTPCHRCLYLIQ